MKRLIKACVQPTLRQLGYEIVRSRPEGGDAEHELIRPYTTYAPWRSDRAFAQVYQQVREHTLIDIYRLHELWSLVAQTGKVEGEIVEVGVWRGGSGALMAAQAQRLGQRAMVHLCDTFTGVVKAGEHDSAYHGGEHADTSRQVVEQLIASMHLGNTAIEQGIFPDETGPAIEGRPIRLCHIDVDVYQSAADVLEWVWPRLSVGGVVVYDDFGYVRCPGITRHVQEQANRSGAMLVHNLCGHGLLIKTGGAAPPPLNPDKLVDTAEPKAGAWQEAWA